MTIFSRLFGKKEVPKADQDMATAPVIDRSTFIEERSPGDILRETEAVPTQKESSFLESLVEREYYTMGKKDGYEDHDPEIMEMKVDIIAADFRQAYYRALQEIDLRLDKLGRYLTEKMEEEMPDQYGEIHTQHEQLVKQKREILKQIDMAALGEGFIELSVRQYRAGFRKGFALYTEEELTFDITKIL